MSLLEDMQGSIPAQSRITAALNTNIVIVPLNRARAGLVFCNNGTGIAFLSLNQASAPATGISVPIGGTFGPFSKALHGALCTGQWQGQSAAALIIDVVEAGDGTFAGP